MKKHYSKLSLCSKLMKSSVGFILLRLVKRGRPDYLTDMRWCNFVAIIQWSFVSLFDALDGWLRLMWALILLEKKNKTF